MNSLLETLEPEFGVKIANLIVSVSDITNVVWCITSGRRTIAEQDSLYAKGRTDEGDIVTRAKGGQSPHNFGLAADCAPTKNGKPYWPNADDELWNIYGALAVEAGLTWGGNFKSILDVPHVEDSNWRAVQADWKEGKIYVA